MNNTGFSKKNRAPRSFRLRITCIFVKTNIFSDIVEKNRPKGEKKMGDILPF